MKLVTITGPHGAGKDSVIKEVLKRFEKTHPNKVKRALFLTTRSARKEEVPGIDILLASEQEFNDSLEKGELAYSVKMHDYLVGSTWNELKKWDNLLVNITFEGAKILKQKCAENNGKVFMIALNAPLEERKRRIKLREPYLHPAKLNSRLANDPRNNIEEQYHEFDLVIQNHSGQFEQTVKTVMAASEIFFNS